MKYAMKVVTVSVLSVLTSPAWLAARADHAWFESERAFDFFAKLLSLVPGRIGQYLRASFYVRTLARCPCDILVGFGSFFAHPTAAVGRHVSIGSFSIIGTAVFGDHVLVASRVSILSGKYQHGGGGLAPSAVHGRYDRVRIGSGSWIGEGAVIMADVGAHCIVSAGSVVTKAVPDRSTAVGNPARSVRYADKTLTPPLSKKTELLEARG